MWPKAFSCFSGRGGNEKWTSLVVCFYLILFGSEFESLEGLVWQAFGGMFECSHVVPGWNDEGKQEANGREEGLWRCEGPKMRPTYTLSDQQAHVAGECAGLFLHRYSASQCNMFVKLLWLECRYTVHCTSLVTRHVFIPCELRQLGIARKGKSSIVELEQLSYQTFPCLKIIADLGEFRLWLNQKATMYCFDNRAMCFP